MREERRSMRQDVQRVDRTLQVWRLAQLLSVAIAVVVVALLVVRPEWGLFVTWSVLIPAVPALLLVAPRLWRNLCPIAVVHQLPVVARMGGERRLSQRAARWAPVAAGVAFLLIVPLRHAVFNEHGPALAAFVLAVLSVSLAGGLLFAGKSGWCSTFCPVGPVEKLYGQRPLVDLPHAHCTECVGCTGPCFDRDGAPAIVRLLGEDPEDGGATSEEGARILQSPMGAFAAGFPGFVLGYFTVNPDAWVGSIYLYVGLFAAASLALFATVQTVFFVSARSAVLAAAAAAAGLYYWFTVPAVVDAVEVAFQVGPLPGWVNALGQGALLALVAVWLLDAPRRQL